MSDLADKQIIEATISICSHLEFSPFLESIDNLTKDFSPVDKILLAGFYPSDSVMMVLGISDREGSREVSNRLRTEMDVAKALGGMGAPITMFRRASAALPAKGLIEAGLIAGDASLIVVRMVIGKKMIGLLFLVAEPGKEFERSHGNTLAQLRQPLSVGIKNCFHYRNIRNRHQKLSDNFKHFNTNMEDGEIPEEIIGADMGLRGIMPEVRKAGTEDDNLCLIGETGSGRKFLARTIHQLSGRQEQPFIEVNCARIPEAQLADYLFGLAPEVGQTLFDSKKGLFQRASGGSAVISGVLGLPLEIRKRLAELALNRSISTGRDGERLKCDVRLFLVLDEQHRSELSLVESMTAHTITIPPLRDRKEDLARLAEYFIEKHCRLMNRSEMVTLDKNSLPRCYEYEWPGNVKELSNLIENAILHNDTGQLDLASLTAGRSGNALRLEDFSEAELDLDTCTTNHIKRVMSMTGGKVGGEHGAARLLGVNPSTLRKRMRKLQIPFGRKAHY
ncbi:MAG: hypothetical protein D6B25_13445 [Desulfobulbaceae bacterium]|nr:MAG: hypothetical protein D6B25_13445 [Desulfobulbaceae bacterium]